MCLNILLCALDAISGRVGVLPYGWVARVFGPVVRPSLYRPRPLALVCASVPTTLVPSANYPSPPSASPRRRPLQSTRPPISLFTSRHETRCRLRHCPPGSCLRSRHQGRPPRAPSPRLCRRRCVLCIYRCIRGHERRGGHPCAGGRHHSDVHPGLYQPERRPALPDCREHAVPGDRGCFYHHRGGRIPHVLAWSARTP